MKLRLRAAAIEDLDAARRWYGAAGGALVRRSSTQWARPSAGSWSIRPLSPWSTVTCAGHSCSAGRAVLDGRISALALGGFDEHLGGVHVSTGSGDLWVRTDRGVVRRA